MRMRIVAAALLLALPSMAQEPTGTDATTTEEDLLAASRAVANAQTHFDLQTLEARLAPGYVEVSPIGDVDERDEVLGFYTPEAKAEMLARGIEPIAVTLAEPRVQVHGDHGIVITRQDAELEIKGAVQRRSFRTTHHFRKIDGKWMLQSAQFTPLKAEPVDEQA